QYFHSRPSAVNYDANNSNGSQWGPTNQKLIDRVNEDVNKLQVANSSAPIPIDLVTTSASGLDPHITPAAAEFQIPRIAAARRAPSTEIRRIVKEHTEGRTWGLLG